MTASERIRVLHVDDDPEFADLTAEMLEREDDRVTVRTATSAGEGLDRLDDQEFDCIVSDYDMPGMNGIEFLERVREEYETLPFVLYTGKGSEEIASDAISAGVTDYLQKEAGTGQYTVLTNRVANAVEQFRAKKRVRERERELARQNERLAELVEKHEAAETRYRSLFENAPIVVWEEDLSEVKEQVDDLAAEVDDLEAHLEEDRETLLELIDAIEIRDVNEYAVEHYDAPSKERLMENLDRLATEQSYEAYKEEFLALAAGETQITVETQAWTLDGDLKDELLHVFVPEAYTEDCSRVYVAVTDITERKDRERDLERERERLDTVVSNIPVIVFALDPEGVFTLSRGKGLEALGLEPGEVVGESVFDRYEGYEAQLEDIERALDGERVTGEYEVQGFVFETTFQPVFDDDVGVRAVIGVSIDVTDRKERERELEEYRTLVETVGDPMYMLDPEGNITMVNDAVVEQWGYSRDELLSMHASEVMPDEDYDRGTALIRELLEDSERTWGTFEMESITADGTRLVNENRVGVITDDGDYLGSAGVIRDITDRKERERERERRYEAIFNQTYQFTGLLEPDGTVIEANETALEFGGLDHEDVIGKPFWEAYWWQTDDETQRELREAIDRAADGEFVRYDVEVQGEDETVVIDFSIRPVTDEDGTVTYLIPEGRDITNLKALHDRERELERQNERLEEFVSIVSHDLRNPLNVAQGSLQLAREECDTEHLDDAANAVDRSFALLDDLLALAREGEQVSEVEPVALADTIRSCWRTVETADATLVVETDRTVRADSGRLKQLLENLVRNAVEHGGEDVTVTLGDLDGGFYVADDGPGIPPDERDQVFDAGYSSADEGTGFGLNIVTEIAEAHGWDVRVTDSEDGGARFEIRTLVE